MFRSEGAGVLRPKRTFSSRRNVVLALVLTAVVLAFLSGAYPLATTAVYASLLAFIVLVSGVRSTAAKLDEGTLSVEADAITIDGRLVARRSDLRAAFIVPSGEGTFVHLERKGRFESPVNVRLRDEAEAQALLRELGFDAEHTTAQVRVASSFLAMPLWKQLALIAAGVFVFIPAVTLLAGLNSPLLAMAPVIALFGYAFGIAFAPTTVRIGTDGIITRWLGHTRFIAHRDIDDVATYEEWARGKQQLGVHLVLKGGEKVRLPLGHAGVVRDDASRLLRRIEDARGALRGDAVVGATDLLARGERSFADWIRFLRAMGAGAIGPRMAAVPQDVLLRLVEDSKATPLERASAAVAAVASGDDEAKRRVRIAADATASPKLRVALEKLSSSEAEAEVEEAAALEALIALNDERDAP